MKESKDGLTEQMRHCLGFEGRDGFVRRLWRALLERMMEEDCLEDGEMMQTEGQGLRSKPQHLPTLKEIHRYQPMRGTTWQKYPSFYALSELDSMNVSVKKFLLLFILYPSQSSRQECHFSAVSWVSLDNKSCACTMFLILQFRSRLSAGLSCHPQYRDRTVLWWRCPVPYYSSRKDYIFVSLKWRGNKHDRTIPQSRREH